MSYTRPVNINSWVTGMSQTVNLATARELAAAGAVRHATLLGRPGGFAIVLRVGMADQLLATKLGEPRIFAQMETAAELLRGELGVARFDVDASNYSKDDLLRRRNPKVRATRLKEREAIQHDRWFRERVGATLAKTDKGYQPLDVVFDRLDKRAQELRGGGASA